MVGDDPNFGAGQLVCQPFAHGHRICGQCFDYGDLSITLMWRCRRWRLCLCAPPLGVAGGADWDWDVEI